MQEQRATWPMILGSITIALGLAVATIIVVGSWFMNVFMDWGITPDPRRQADFARDMMMAKVIFTTSPIVGAGLILAPIKKRSPQPSPPTQIATF